MTAIDSLQERTFSFQQPRTSPWRPLFAVGRFVRNKPLGAFGALVLTAVIVIGAFSPWIANYEPDHAVLRDALAGTSGDHWFGTDENGRDIYSRIVFGAQVTAMVGIGTVVVVITVALAVGLISGYFAGKTDFMIQRGVDIWLASPRSS